MRGNWHFFLFICYLSDISVVLCDDTRKLEPGLAKIVPIEEVQVAQPSLVDGKLYKVFKKYYCRLFNNIERRQTLLYGTQGWTFPRQDVNLTLVYPSADRENEEYVITGYQVILFIDGPVEDAYIGSGGMLQDKISLTFICKGITTLSYQFWLYGAKPARISPTDRQNMC